MVCVTLPPFFPFYQGKGDTTLQGEITAAVTQIVSNIQDVSPFVLSEAFVFVQKADALGTKGGRFFSGFYLLCWVSS